MFLYNKRVPSSPHVNLFYSSRFGVGGKFGVNFAPLKPGSRLR
jgi:hypothetical protein